MPFRAVSNRFHRQIDLDSLRTVLDALVNEGELEKAIEQLKEWITVNPLEEKAFLLLGELYEKAGLTNAVIIAFERAFQLKEISANYKPSPSLLRYQELIACAINDPQSYFFPGFKMKYNGKTEKRDAFLKIHEERKAAL